MSTAGQAIDDPTHQAITYKIGHEFEDLRSGINRYIVDEASKANSTALALHRAYGHLRTDLVPEMLERVIAFCLDLELRDADLVALKIKTAFEPQLKALGQSLGLSYQSPSSVGMTMREIANFSGWVDAYCAGICSRVHVAVEKRRHMIPAAAGAPADSGKMNVTTSGSANINNDSLGNSQNDGGGGVPHPPSLSKKWARLGAFIVGMAAIVSAVVAVMDHVGRAPASASPVGGSPPGAPAPSSAEPILPTPLPAPTARPHNMPKSQASPPQPDKGGIRITGNINAPSNIGGHHNTIIAGPLPRRISGSDRKKLNAVPAETCPALIVQTKQPSAQRYVKQIEAYYSKRSGCEHLESTWMIAGEAPKGLEFVPEGHGIPYHGPVLTIGDRDDGVDE